MAGERGEPLHPSSLQTALPTDGEMGPGEGAISDAERKNYVWGAKSTEVGCEPGPKALKSIYSYSFEIMAPCTAESDSESCPSPIFSRGHSKASAAEQTVNYSTTPASRAAPSRDSDPQRGAGAQESQLSIADSGAGARGGDSAPESAAADEGAAEPENERDGVGGRQA